MWCVSAHHGQQWYYIKSALLRIAVGWSANYLCRLAEHPQPMHRRTLFAYCARDHCSSMFDSHWVLEVAASAWIWASGRPNFRKRIVWWVSSRGHLVGFSWGDHSLFWGAFSNVALITTYTNVRKRGELQTAEVNNDSSEQQRCQIRTRLSYL